jgi:5'-3' exonuclease
MDFKNLTESVALSIIRNVISKIESYISIVKPSATVIIAFDGVAPVAKLEQQRNRRYKSWFQNEYSKKLFNKPTDDVWNTAAITPGTKFMKELNEMVSKHFDNECVSKLNISNVFVSGSNEAGEGEHKLFDFIRKNPEKHQSETTVIYGLDADLIMLSINHLPICPNIYLFRETPHFIQSIDSSLEPDENYFMDIPELTRAIIKYMNNDNEHSDIGDHVKNKIYDYIFLCFFLGNDFLPHFPATNIRTGGVDKMLNAYRATMGEKDNLTDGKIIYWNNVRKIIQWLTNAEEQFIISEHKLRNSREKRETPQTSPEEKYKRFELTPMYERDIEKYINPFKPFWQQRYYRSLFGIKSDTTGEHIKDICVNYLQGLEWTMKYYTTGCPDWRWRYKYDYPPLFQDLIKHVPVFSTTFVETKPFHPVSELVQLCYVLPKHSLQLLPQPLHNALISKHARWYSDKCEFVWAYCQYFWEAHVEMSDIDIQELEIIVSTFIKTRIDM